VNLLWRLVQLRWMYTEATTTASMLSMNIGVLRHPAPFKTLSNCFSVSSKMFLGV
jgi:hypothetical protein